MRCAEFFLQNLGHKLATVGLQALGCPPYAGSWCEIGSGLDEYLAEGDAERQRRAALWIIILCWGLPLAFLAWLAWWGLLSAADR